jgi:predicted HicB family RNase H-like nuclease
MRTTSDPKNEKIKLRLNEELKSHVQKYADKEYISLSEYIRELIRQDMRNKR